MSNRFKDSTTSNDTDLMPARQSSRQGRQLLLYAKQPTEATPVTHGWEMVFHTGSSKLYFPLRIWSNSAGSLSS